MYLSEIKIAGYKIFNEEFKINFNKGLTVLIGENGNGKTAVVDAVRLLLNEDEFGRIGILESHFHRPMDKPANEGSVSRIELRAKFSDLDDEQQVAYLPWLDAHQSSVAYLNKRIENKSNNRGRFDHTTWGGESSMGIFEWELIDAISCIYLPPLRDAESKLEAYRGSRISRLFRRSKPKKGEPRHSIETAFAKFSSDLVQDLTIKEINDAIRKYLKESLGSVMGQDAVIQFSETSFDRIVEKLRLLFYPKILDSPKPELFRDISENSLGYNNILYLATVLAELDGLENETTKHKILLIEEPEAHLHPQLQVRLLKYLKEQCEKKGIQIIITTHSATITSSCGINNLNVLTSIKDKGPVSTLIKDCKLNPNDTFFLERWLDITKSIIFFAKGLLFVEAIAEALVIEELAKRVISKHVSQSDTSPKALNDYGVSIVNLNGIYFRHFMQMFQGYKLDEKGDKIPDVSCVPIRCAGITDCDPQKVKETKPTFTSPCECGNSHSTKYANELIHHSSMNCRIFTNLKTFEYDLGMEGNNLQTLYKIVHSAYEREVAGAISAKTKSEKDWTVVSETERAEECFLLLEEVEDTKGEFAQKLAYILAKETDLDFKVPKYIEDAILWVTRIVPNSISK